MKLTVNGYDHLDVIGCGHLMSGSTTIMYTSTEPLSAIAERFQNVARIDAYRPKGIETYSGNGVLVAVTRNAGSDTVAVTLSGLSLKQEGVSE